MIWILLTLIIVLFGVGETAHKKKPGSIKERFQAAYQLVKGWASKLKSMKKKTVVRIVLAVLAAAIIGGCIYLDTLMPIITGYAAKNLASDVFVSGRNPEDVESLDLNFSFIKFTRNKVDFENRTVTSRFLWRKATAVYREGFGVTLLRGKQSQRDALLQTAYPLSLEEGGPAPLAPGDSALAARLAPIAEAMVDRQAYNGTPFAFVVMHSGGVVAERYREGITPQTQLLSWSMGKSFTNALIGIMSGDGMVDIDAPLDIPEWQGDGRRAITLRDLMQMQSGLQWNEDYGNRSDVNLMLHRETDMGLYALSKPLEYEPGTHWYYSSGSTNIVMRYLRGKFASDAEFLGYLRERLFAPLGIRNPRFEPDMSGTPVGSSYLYVTARDYARFGQMFLDDGCVDGVRILPEGWVDFTVTPASASDNEYGAFFWLNRNHYYPDAPEDLFSCQGHDGQMIFMIPSKDLVLVILGYSPKPDRMIDFNGLLKDIIACL
ncbi:MAG: beta-lactamase family protein [Bacteroidales bacterium]|nr:beta-lactamase family protein [Bacteroidales bacterium]